MNPEFALINWINKRTFAAAMFTQSIYVNLINAKSPATDSDVALCLKTLLGRDYTDVDVRLIMGRPANSDEEEALRELEVYLRAFDAKDNPNVDLDAKARELIRDGKDPHWVGYVAEYLRSIAAYRKDCQKVLEAYQRAVASLPVLENGSDLTLVVGYPDHATQPTEVAQFIELLSQHFRMLDNVFLVPPVEVWPLSRQIILRTLETENGPVVTVPTPRGVIVVNATPT